MALIELIEFKALGDERGCLISLEQKYNIPFELRRVYYLYGTEEGASRGFHAHKALEQVAICVAGRCRFVLDDGRNREEIVLDSPEKGLYIGNNIWREMYDFSTDCVLLVLASELYDESDYIRDYAEYLSVANGA